MHRPRHAKYIGSRLNILLEQGETYDVEIIEVDLTDEICVRSSSPTGPSFNFRYEDAELLERDWDLLGYPLSQGTISR